MSLQLVMYASWLSDLLLHNRMLFFAKSDFSQQEK